jgi:hypothetical protein
LYLIVTSINCHKLFLLAFDFIASLLMSSSPEDGFDDAVHRRHLAEQVHNGRAHDGAATATISDRPTVTSSVVEKKGITATVTITTINAAASTDSRGAQATRMMEG